MSITMQSIASARSLLVVPGHRPDRFAKAAQSGADAIMLDLEDAVGPDLKAVARENIDHWLSAGGTGVIRINGIASPWYEEDVAMLAGRPTTVMLPKVGSPDEVGELLAYLPKETCVIPAIETAVGVLDARKILSTKGVVRAVFGNADFSTELGVDLSDRETLIHARFQIVLASAACGIAPPLDGVTTEITNEQALTADAEHAVALGFTGKACLHPCQVPVVNDIFSPSDEKLRWAREVVASAGDGSVGSRNGQLIGKPIVERARRLISQFERKQVQQ